MIFYDGIYRLRQHGKRDSKSFGKWAYSWRIRIINLSISQPDVRHLRPFIVVATQSEESVFRANCAETLGKNICRDFFLNINNLLWVEYFPDKPDQIYAAIFTPKSYFRTEIFYSVNWRPVLPNELEVIKFFIQESESL